MRSIGVVAVVLCFSPLFLQTRIHAQSPPTTANLSIGLCEDTDGCSLLNFTNGHANAHWATGGNGTFGSFTLQHLDATSISIARKDVTGWSTGLTALYTGTVTGYTIEGTATAQIGNQPVVHTKWHAILRPDLKPLPPGTIVHLPATATAWLQCEDIGDFCSTNPTPPRYVMTMGASLNSMRNLGASMSTVLIQYDTDRPGAIEFRRIDLDGQFPGLSGIYTGVREGNVMHGTSTWIIPGQRSPWHGKWIAHLAPRTCDAATTASLAAGSWEAMTQAHFLLGDKAGAVRCAQVGLEAGNLQMKYLLAQLYATGDGVPKDPAKSFAIYKALAAQGEPLAMFNLGVLYITGTGTPLDTLRGRYWQDAAKLAQEDKNTLNRMQQAPTPLEAIGVFFNQEFIQGIPKEQQAIEGRVAHRGDVIDYLNKGMSRVQAEESAARDEINVRQQAADECKQRADEEERIEAQEHGTQWVVRHQSGTTCMMENMKLNSFADGAKAYLACVHQYVQPEAIDAHCNY